MAVELNLVKAESDSWGFRLTGGAEYDVPLTVIKVTENSIADKGGLRSGDVIVRVNETATGGLTHGGAHDAIISAGNNLNLAVRRDATGLISPSTCDDEINEEISNIMQACTDEEMFEHQRHVHFEMVNSVVEEQQTTEQVLTEEASNQHTETKIEAPERKWSTFLQKPNNPKPAIKKTDDPPEGEPYRVIITKQKKKVPEQETNQELNESVQSVEIEISEECEQSLEASVEASVDISEEVEIQTDVVASAVITEEGQLIIDEEKEDKESEETTTEVRLQNEKNVAVEKLLEEKLAEVQKQLEALSKLPSTIQSTIDAVTKQLATIVNIKTTTTETEEIVVSNVSSDSEDNHAEQLVTERSNSLESEVVGEETVDVDEETEIKIDELEENESNNEVQEENHEEQDPDEDFNEEENEARRVQEELLEKQKKELEQLEEFKQRRLKQKPTLPLKPIERPIILPGGRKWSQPDDACPSIRNPKMSDEKIANTIENYSEVILGKTKGLTTGTRSGPGPIKKRQYTESNCSMVPSRTIATKTINFLKYQPPPKNLDYLQRSDVYKLVHDMEPPVRGISSRASKILATEDYYQAG